MNKIQIHLLIWLNTIYMVSSYRYDWSMGVNHMYRGYLSPSVLPHLSEDDRKIHDELWHMTSDIIKDTDTLYLQLQYIRQDIGKNAPFEIGFVIFEILEMYRKMVDNGRTLKLFKAIMYPVEHLWLLEENHKHYFELEHLVNMLHEIERKFGLNKGNTTTTTTTTRRTTTSTGTFNFKEFYKTRIAPKHRSTRSRNRTSRISRSTRRRSRSTRRRTTTKRGRKTTKTTRKQTTSKNVNNESEDKETEETTDNLIEDTETEDTPSKSDSDEKKPNKDKDKNKTKKTKKPKKPKKTKKTKNPKKNKQKTTKSIKGQQNTTNVESNDQESDEKEQSDQKEESDQKEYSDEEEESHQNEEFYKNYYDKGYDDSEGVEYYYSDEEYVDNKKRIRFPMEYGWDIESYW